MEIIKFWKDDATDVSFSVLQFWTVAFNYNVVFSIYVY